MTQLTNEDLRSSITLRPVTQADREFLLDVYAASREIELSMVPWDAEQKRAFVINQFDAQLNYYESEYLGVSHDIILFNDQAAGRLFVSRGGTAEIVIMDVTVLPDHRKQGIGTHLIEGLKIEAREAGKMLRVWVETFNPSQELFRKLGFNMAEADGMNLRFEWKSPDKVTKT